MGFALANTMADSLAPGVDRQGPLKDHICNNVVSVRLLYLDFVWFILQFWVSCNVHHLS